MSSPTRPAATGQNVPDCPALPQRRKDLRPVLSSGPTSLPVGPVDSKDVRIGVSGCNKVGPGGLSFRNMAISAW